MRIPDEDTRAVMVLSREAERMRDAAERVALVVRAMALRRGVKVQERNEYLRQEE